MAHWNSRTAPGSTLISSRIEAYESRGCIILGAWYITLMNGKITFETLKELAEFLKNFTGSSSLFEVTKGQNQWLLEFTGGY
jgi:hypothetical protein